MTRRQILRMAGCSAGLSVAGEFSRFRLMNALAGSAADSEYRALICLFFLGGNDGNNFIIPLESKQFDAYTQIRGQLAFPSSSLLPITTNSNDGYALHPALNNVQ